MGLLTPLFPNRGLDPGNHRNISSIQRPHRLSHRHKAPSNWATSHQVHASYMQLDLVAFRIVQNQSLQVDSVVLEGFHVSACASSRFKASSIIGVRNTTWSSLAAGARFGAIPPRRAFLLDQIDAIARDQPSCSL